MGPAQFGADMKLIRSKTRIILLLTITSATYFTFLTAQRCHISCECRFNQILRTICSVRNLTKFPENLNESVEYLDLSRNRISEVPDYINRLSALKNLNLAYNILTSLPINLNGLQKLEELDLRGNNFSGPNGLSPLNQLSSLDVLHLSQNQIKQLDGIRSRNLQTLHVSHCGIEQFNKTSLNGFPKLKSLNLEGNPLKSIQAPSSSHLVKLDLSDCNLTYLNPDTFKYLPNLEELIMKNNKQLYYSIREKTLHHKNLRILDVSNCNLDRPGLHEFPALEHASLSYNGIHILPDRIFAKNQALTHLYLDSNRIGHLNKSSFAGLMNLQILDLSSNDLRELPWSIFNENKELRCLNLSANNIEVVGNLTTWSVSVDLSFNQISKVNPNTLMNMPRIRVLNLSNNFLEDLSEGLQSTTLEILEFRRNRLVQLTAQMFAGLPELITLDLFGNRLTEGPDREIFINNRNLRILRLADNPWRCDCSQLSPIHNYLMRLPVNEEMGSLICQSPVNVSGYSWENACKNEWFEQIQPVKHRSWGLIMISILTLVIAGGTILSIKHAINTKRSARNEIQSLERAEARERLRLLQRRNQRLEEELRIHVSEPRIHPMEHIGPPSYEEAVHMQRLAHSLDGLDAAPAESTAAVTRILGSVDNLRMKKRRPRRSKKRTLSENDLARREERRAERIKRNTSRIRINNQQSAEQSIDSDQSANVPAPSSLSVRGRLKSDSDHDATDSPKSKMRPPTPTAKKKKRILLSKAGTSTDDEDSDVQNTRNRKNTGCTIILQNLPREPRSGYRPTSTTDDADVSSKFLQQRPLNSSEKSS